MTNRQATYIVETLDKGIIYVLSRTKQDDVRFQDTTPNNVQFKTNELFISRIFHPIFSGHGCHSVTETMESKTTDNGDYCNINSTCLRS